MCIVQSRPVAIIRAGTDLFTVVVRVRTPSADDRPQVLDICRATQQIFARQPGFVSSSLHLGDDGDEIVSYLQWRTRADHEACLRSPDFGTPGGRRLMQRWSKKAAWRSTSAPTPSTR